MRLLTFLTTSIALLGPATVLRAQDAGNEPASAAEVKSILDEIRQIPMARKVRAGGRTATSSSTRSSSTMSRRGTRRSRNR